ncbi:hypothetical protein C0Q70_07773 [Pomacea canaliculata]|uniref:Homeobox domain-containing protein n=1 Tax=Pomacea canaliculata TaxID=400727 RepID=A0A2T7PG43_POMCA|nr:hypothetical protein C0Q70_07773 [Pomacea canaliculata]
MKFSIDNILGLHKTLPSAHLPAHLTPSHSGFGCNLNAVGDDSRGMNKTLEGKKESEPTQQMATALQGKEATTTTVTSGYSARATTRPSCKLAISAGQEQEKDCGSKKRKFGRNPRVPFTQHQVAVLEERFDKLITSPRWTSQNCPQHSPSRRLGVLLLV